MQHLIDFPQVHVIYVGGWSKILNPTVSLVCFSIGGYQIIMASHHFKRDATKVKTYNLYEQLGIGFNCDLSGIAHGTDKDVPNVNMPKFHAWSNKMHVYLEKNKDKSVLVNCNNGRSRTGTVVALYLMKYHNLSADNAISIVTSVLRFRGIVKDSINIQTTNLNGNYGDWLRRWEVENKNVRNEKADAKSYFKRKADTQEKLLIVEPMADEDNEDDECLPVAKKLKFDTSVETQIQISRDSASQHFFKKSENNSKSSLLITENYNRRISVSRNSI